MEPTILTVSGRYVNLLRPSQDSIVIEDIAHALSKLSRFTGHTLGNEIYSVAQHSVLVSKTVPPEYAMDGLLHDAQEAYLGDCSSPLKSLLQDYRYLEGVWEEAISIRFKVLGTSSPTVKYVDRVLLATEKRDLVPGEDGPAWGVLQGITPLERPITPLPPLLARTMFLNRYYELLPAHLEAA